MAVYRGNTALPKVYKGATPITKIYKGDTLVYTSETLLPETVALLARYDVQPNAAMIVLINALMQVFKTSGILAVSDCIYVRGLHTAQAACENWVKDAFNSTLVNNPVFTAGEGFKGDGAASYINNNFYQSPNALHFLYTSATVVYLCKILGTVNARCVWGAHKNAGVQYLQSFFYTAAVEKAFLNSGNSLNYDNLDAGALMGLAKTGTTVRGYKNGVQTVADQTATAANLSTLSMYELCTNAQNGTPASFFNGQLSFSIYAAYLDATQMLAMHTGLRAFYDRVSDAINDRAYGISQLYDGGTAAWWTYDQPTTITKDGSNLVSAWSSRINSERVLLQADPARQPLWSANGIVFDGVADFLKALTFPLKQPEFIYMVVKVNVFQVYGTLFDGNANNVGNALGNITTDKYYAGAGTISPDFTMSTGSWHILRVLFNGANSKIIVDNGTPTTWNCGAAAMNGFCLGKIGSETLYFSNINVKEIIVRAKADTSGDEAAIYNYLSTKYGI